MIDPATPSVLGGPTTAIAAACHHAQSSHEPATRCRAARGSTLRIAPLRDSLARHPELGHATFSAGLTEAPGDGHHRASLLAAADAAPCRAKGAGRDTVWNSLDG